MRQSKQLYNFGTPWMNIVILMAFCYGLQLTSAEKKFGSKCTAHNECETKYCHEDRKSCDCPKAKDYSSGKKLEQIYDYDLCLSRVNQFCTFPGVDDGLPPFNCIPEATCEGIRKGKGQSTVFGKCSCKHGYTSSANGKKCMSNAELRAQAPVSMDQKVSEDWARSGSSSNILEPRSVYAMISLVILCLMFPFR